MEVVCKRDCYNSTTAKLYEKGRVYSEDDRELEGRDLMKHFDPLNKLPPAKAQELVAREETVQAKAARQVAKGRRK